MRLLVLDIDGEGMGVDLALRAQEADHDVRYWLPPHKSGDRLRYGDGLLEKPREFEPSMGWAELIVCIGNSTYQTKLAEYFGKGFPIFGTNIKAAELELDREKGMDVLEKAGIKVAPYAVISSPEEGVELITRTNQAFAMKPWGGLADKAMTYVAKTPDDGIFTLQKWKKEGLFKGQLMMQKKVEGVEIGISGMFGPGGWCKAKEESFEHKKFLNDDLGENTGEMGTVIRHVARSRLFDQILDPITDYLHAVNFVGDCSVNCIVDKEGVPWPLEFTMRLGWPDFCIRQAVIKADPVEWMADLIFGKDSFKVSPEIAVGVVMTHGDFPRCDDVLNTWHGYPIYGVRDLTPIHFQQACEGKAPFLVNGQVEEIPTYLTAGNYVMVVTGTGDDVETAARNAYTEVEGITWPSNVMYRTDIGKRLKKDLPKLQKHGIAVGMEY